MIQSLAERAKQLQLLLVGMEYSPLVSDNKKEKQEQGELTYQYAVNLLSGARNKKGNIYLVGNGGSAAIVSHAKTDLMNEGKIKAITLHGPAIMTCLSNDYGYEHVFSRQLDVLANTDDVLIAVSSSGQSSNILNAVETMRSKNAQVITLTGFNIDNPLRQKGDLNYWINSGNYTLVEIAHLFILYHLAVCLKEE